MKGYNDIFKKIKRGDKKAFKYLFTMLYPSLCNYSNSLIHDLSDTEEIVQDVFYNIWMKKNEIDIKTDIEPYIFTSVKNKCLAYIKHRNIKAKFVLNFDSTLKINSYGVDEYIENNEMESLINDTLNSFPEKMRNIFILSRFEGLKYREIAKRLSILVKTVEANISKALKVFKRNFGEYVNLS